MKYVVMDLEWNQAMVYKKKKPGLNGEIMQIAAVKIDEELNIIEEFNQMIKPNFYPQINKEIKELTLITEEELYAGLPFPEAAENFRKWCGDEFKFVSWGTEDTRMLVNNLDIYEMDDSWIPDTIDAQVIFDDQFIQDDRSFALNYALWYFEEKPDGAHNALADVYSTIKVMKHMDMEEGFSDEYYVIDYSGGEDDEA